MFFAFIVIAWGVSVGFKSVKFEFEDVDENINIEEVSNEVYIDEINLPLIEVDSLNPLKTKNNQVLSVLKLIYEPMVDFDSDESLEFILLDEYAKLDSKTWIFKLKQDVLWHNNEKFKSNDVIFTFNMLKNNDLIYSNNLSNVKEVVKLDDYSIKVILENEDDYFISKLNFPIISENYFKDFNSEEKASKPMGTGAYKYLSSNNDESIILEFNSSWHIDESAKLKKINLFKYASYGEAVKAFKSAEVDVIVTNMSEWKDKFGTIGLNSYSFENSEYEVIIPNCSNLALSDNSVRRAILQAINRENLINSVYGDNASISDIPIHTNSKNSINNAEYDLEKAKQILINAGWIQETDGIWQKEIDSKIQKLKFELLVNKDNIKKVEVAEKIKNDLNEIGIPITIKQVQNDNLKKALLEDKFELALTSFDIKNEYFVQEQISNSSKLNYANYNSDSMQNIIDNMKINYDFYKDNIHFLAQLYKNDAPYIGLYFKTSTIITNKSVKGNFEPSWSNYYRNITSFCK